MRLDALGPTLATTIATSALVALVAGPASAGGPVTHYTIEADLRPSQGTLAATAALTLSAPEGGLQKVDLLLNHGLSLRSVSCDAGVKSVHFDRSEASSYRYAPKAAPLRIELANPVVAGQTVVVRVQYEGTIDPDPWLTNVLTPEWVELASYAAWYPQDPASTAYTYSLRVKTEPGYALAGSVPGSQEGEAWTARRDSPSWDIVVVAARGLRVRHVGAGGGALDVWNVGTSPVDPTAAKFAGDVGRMMEEMGGWFGPLGSRKVTIVFAERKSGGGYYRPGFMSLLFDADYRGLAKYAAHELAHFWWGRGDATTWQDWLNESFAEYSSLLLTRSWYGREAFTTTLAAYETEAAGKPPIWGLDRNDQNAYAVLYRRGPVLLGRLEERVGEAAFRRLLAALVAREVRTTDVFLTTLRELASPEVADDFEQQLKAR
jgi:hypothetical protein